MNPALPARSPSAGMPVPVIAAISALDGNGTWTLHRSILGPHTALHQIGPPGKPAAWVKCYLAKPGEAGREFDFLRRIRPRFPGQNGLNVAEPLSWLAPHNSLVLRHAEGALLAGRMWPQRPLSPGEIRRIETHCRQAGRWLARLHRDRGAFRPELAQTCAEWVLAQVRQKRRLWALPTGLEDQLRQFAEQCLETARPKDAFLVPTHGDFGPHNVLVADGQLSVIDPSFPEDIPRIGGLSLSFEDLLRFYVCARGYRARHVFSLRQKRWSVAFLRAYQDERGERIDFRNGLFPLFQLKYLLHAWKDWTPPMNSLDRHWIGRRLQFWLAIRRRHCFQKP